MSHPCGQAPVWRRVRIRACATAAAAFFAAIAISPAAQSQSAIGQAVQSAPLVTGALGARRAAISTGSAVHQNETIQTSVEGRTLLQFQDSTHLSVGPSASVKLDRFVYNSDATARQAVMNMTRGAFRFATGASDPGAFRLQTPHATIGIRGTILEINVRASASQITLQQGSIIVCARNGRRGCATLTSSGQSITVGADGTLALNGDAFRGPDLLRQGLSGGDGGRGGDSGRNR